MKNLARLVLVVFLALYGVTPANAFSGDTVKPEVTQILSPSSGDVQGTITLSAKADDPGRSVSGVKVRFHIGSQVVNTSRSGDTFSNTFDTNQLDDGSVQIVVYATDKAGNESDPKFVAVTVKNSAPPQDTIPPTVSVLEPVDRTTVSGTVLIKASASDNVGVTKVQLKANTVLLAELTQLPYEFSWDTNQPQFSDGDYVLKAIAFDAAGLTTEAVQSVTIRNRDLTAPVMTMLDPQPGFVKGGMIQLRVQASDNVAVSHVDFFKNGQLLGQVNGDLGTFSYDWNSSSEPNGEVTLSAKAYDAEGNYVSASVTGSVLNSDSKAPLVTLTSPVNGTTLSNQVMLSASASDETQLEAVFFTLNGDVVGSELNAAPFEMTWNSKDVGDGEYAFQAWARDVAGNIATSEQAVVTVQNNQLPAEPVAVTVDNFFEYQPMEGFGAWHHNAEVYVGSDLITPTQRKTAVDKIFSEIQITTGDVPAILEASCPTCSPANDNSDPHVMNVNGFQTQQQLDLFRSKYMDLIDPEKETHLYPRLAVDLKSNSWLKNIRFRDKEAYYDELAEQVLVGVQRWVDSYGEVPAYIQLFHEPTTGENTMSAFFGNQSNLEMAEIIKRAGNRLSQEGFESARFVIGNQNKIFSTKETITDVLADPDALKYVGAIGYYPDEVNPANPQYASYSYIPNILTQSGAGKPALVATQQREELAAIASAYDLPLWMCGVKDGYLETDAMDVRSFDVALGRAIHIHDEVTFAHASAFFARDAMKSTMKQAMDAGTDGSDLYVKHHDNLLLIDSNSGDVHMTGMARALGHYARWVPRRSQSIKAYAEDGKVKVAAFRNDLTQQLNLVLVNADTVDRQANITMNGLMAGGQVIGEVSDETAYWQPVSFAMANAVSNMSVRLPKRSIMSLRVSLSETGQLPAVGIREIDSSNFKETGFQKAGWKFVLDPQKCTGQGCDKLAIIFSGGMMRCLEGSGDSYDPMLEHYKQKGYVAVCAQTYNDSYGSGAYPFLAEAERVNKIIEDVASDPVIQKAWSGKYLLFTGVSHGATAPVVAMAKTTFDNAPAWKGTVQTGACFFDGIQNTTGLADSGVYGLYDFNVEHGCKKDDLLPVPLSFERMVRRYCGKEEMCPEFFDKARPDNVTDVNPVNDLAVTEWKMISCGDGADSPCTRDVIPKEPIESFCTTVDGSPSHNCTFVDLPDTGEPAWKDDPNSHSMCSITSIHQCSNWFDALVGDQQ